MMAEFVTFLRVTVTSRNSTGAGINKRPIGDSDQKQFEPILTTTTIMGKHWRESFRELDTLSKRNGVIIKKVQHRREQYILVKRVCCSWLPYLKG